MPDNVIIAKADIVERCIKRAREELAASQDFVVDYTRQDAAILNVERACEAAIDIMNRIIRLRSLGAPASTRDGFDRLVRAGVIDQALADKLMRMVGFRNLAVHQYQALDIAIVRAVIEKSLDDLLDFSAIALRL
ncbi:MAG: toxin-antitoxin antitoxin component [Proteobacteria bacterium HN_bin10]|nr:MAG: toxin-antitoxin antitoxin component [Proteobacteria bacterium HN_bin10]